MAGQHAFLAPSAAGRWGVCALSPSLEAAYPDTEESPESLEGTAAHWVLQLAVEGRAPAEGVQAPNGVAVTDEMLEGADVAMAAFEKALGPQWREMIVIERPVAVPDVHPSLCWGTPDAYAWARLPDGRLVLFVFDYKFGRKLVVAYRNKQITTYVSGLLSAAGINGQTDQQTLVVMTVIQPRSYQHEGVVRRWDVAASDLRGSINSLRNQADEATSPNPRATVDPDACENCRGRVHCAANQRAGYSAASLPEQSAVVNMPPHALGLELRNMERSLALLESRVEGLRAEAEALVRKGQPVPYWSMQKGRGSLVWTQPDAVVLALGQASGVELAKPPKPITPTQAKAAGMPEAVVDSFAQRIPGADKLTPDDGEGAARVFGV